VPEDVTVPLRFLFPALSQLLQEPQQGQPRESYLRHRSFLLPEPCGVAPQKQAHGTVGWALPLDPDARCIHMGDITELGNIVAGAFAHPDEAGNGEYLPLVGDFMRFNEIVGTLNRQGHNFSFKQVPKEVFAALFPGAAEAAETFRYFQLHTYLVRIRTTELRSQTK
jgi:NmrA-like family protein